MLSVDSLKQHVGVTPRSCSLIVSLTADASIFQPCAALREKLGEVARAANLRDAEAGARRCSSDCFLSRYRIKGVPRLYHFGPNVQVPRTMCVQETPRFVKDRTSQTAVVLALFLATLFAISALLSLYHWKETGYLQ